MTAPSARRSSGASRELGLDGAVELPGPRRRRSRSSGAIAAAACLLLPSLREGYGLVVVEAVARGTPAVVVDGPDNAATELVEPGVNGFVAASADPERDRARVVDAIEARRRRCGARRSTGTARTPRELSIESSLAAVEEAYRD